ncbi:MAG: ion transporter, partial [Gemmatimonadota bacterium]
FETESFWGRAFDVALILAIVASVVVVMLDSVARIRSDHGQLLRGLEWAFTLLFTVEYALRLWSVRSPRAYALSFFGVIDLLAVLPSYLSVLLPGGQFLAVIRVLRVMRVFRVLKLTQFVGEASVLGAALRASRYKISVFLVAVVTIVIVVGSLMYLIEGAPAGFTSIPIGVYWAVVTMTTVGYGDIAPITPVGQALAAFVMILGYGIIAVPTGIVTSELAAQDRTSGLVSRPCPACGHREEDAHAVFCRRCGSSLG